MSTLKVTYISKNANENIQVALDTRKPLTDSIVHLQEQINIFLTNKLEQEKIKVTTVEQDEKEEELMELKAAEEEADAAEGGGNSEDVEMEEASPRPEVVDKQTVKKQKTDA